jgi:endonuclease G, mitochondrial
MQVTMPPANPPANSDPLDAMNSELKSALATLKAAPKQAYYDAERDRKDREKYYGELAENSLKPAQLYQELSELVTRTHTKKLSYKPSVHVYPWVDLRPNLKLQSLYSRQELDPETVIRADLETEAVRSAHQQALKLKTVKLGEVEMRSQLDLLEASLPYNCEHVVPQSWFLKKEPMRGDLHHLFTCEPGCNSFRGNHPYFDFPDFNKVIRNSCGKLESGKFEPGAGKGAAARAVLYFLLRYPGEINKTEREYKSDRLPTLLDWHKAEPPTEYEQHRNAAIFAKQGNRNPVIDFPEWAGAIAFERGLG